MRAFICVGVAIIGTILIIMAGLELGLLDCNGQPCHAATPPSQDQKGEEG